MRRTRNAAFFAVGLLAAYLAACYWAAIRLITPYPGVAPCPEFLARTTITESGRRVPIWASKDLLAGGANPTGVFVLSHGLGGTQAQWQALAKRLVGDGFAVVVPTMPGHDDDPDCDVGFGPKEAAVVADATLWARARCAAGTPIGLVGVSLGGAASWLATELVAVDAVATESAFPTLRQAIDAYDHGVNLFRPAEWIAQRRVGVDPDTVRPIDAARKWRGKPCLVIHPTGDRLFPLSFGEELAGAAGTRCWEIPGARHSGGYSAEPDEYARRVEALLAPRRATR